MRKDKNHANFNVDYRIKHYVPLLVLYHVQPHLYNFIAAYLYGATAIAEFIDLYYCAVTYLG